MKRTPLKKISSKQRRLNQEWREKTLLRWAELKRKCEWCGGYVASPDGHHEPKRRYNISQIPYVCHRLCHDFIGENNINVRKYPSKIEWEAKDE